MYKDYEIKLNAILDKHRTPQKFNFKDVQTVEKVLNEVKSLGNGENLISDINKFKTIHDNAAKDYDK